MKRYTNDQNEFKMIIKEHGCKTGWDPKDPGKRCTYVASIAFFSDNGWGNREAVIKTGILDKLLNESPVLTLAFLKNDVPEIDLFANVDPEEYKTIHDILMDIWMRLDKIGEQ